MIGHLSQIFNPRLLDAEGDTLADYSIDDNALTVHLKLCDSILEVYFISSLYRLSSRD